MKKKLFLLVIISIITNFSVAFCQKQETIVVYAPHSKFIDNGIGINEDTRDFIIGEFIRQIAKENTYTIINRDKEFNSWLDKEANYSQNGNIDDDQIMKMFGNQEGVDYLLLIKLNKVSAYCCLEAKLINVVSSTIIASENDILEDINKIDLLKRSIYKITNRILKTDTRNKLYYSYKRSKKRKQENHYIRSIDENSKYYSHEEALRLFSRDDKTLRIYKHGYAAANSGKTSAYLFGFFAPTSLACGILCHSGIIKTDPAVEKVCYGVAAGTTAYFLLEYCVIRPSGRASIRRAVKRHNNSIKDNQSRYPKTTYGDNLNMSVGITPTGAGLTLNF